jgi:hypothetical protein
LSAFLSTPGATSWEQSDAPLSASLRAHDPALAWARDGSRLFA